MDGAPDSSPAPVGTPDSGGEALGTSEEKPCEKKAQHNVSFKTHRKSDEAYLEDFFRVSFAL